MSIHEHLFKGLPGPIRQGQFEVQRDGASDLCQRR